MNPLAALFLIFVTGWKDAPDKLFVPVSRLMVGPATTVVSGPLKPDGSINFEAAVNARMAHGVTPDSNAMLLLDRAFGPARIPEDLRPRFYEYLGIPESPLTGRYLIRPREYAQRLADKGALPAKDIDDLEGRLNRLHIGAVKRSVLRERANWVDANQEPLRLLEEASKRPAWYCPFVTDRMLLHGPLFTEANIRIGVRLLISRAMFRIEEGDYDGAANDILVCRRLAVLVSRRHIPICIEQATEIEAEAIHATQPLLGRDLTKAQLARYRRAFLEVPPLSSSFESIETFGRLSALEVVYRLWHDNGSVGVPQIPWRLAVFNINRALRTCNAYYDEIARVAQVGGYRQRVQAVADVQSDMSRRGMAAKDLVSSRDLWKIPARDYTKMFAEISVGLIAPDFKMMQIAEEKARTLRQMLDVAFNLAEYRADYGYYPQKLEQLVPRYRAQLPRDETSDFPLHYERKDSYHYPYRLVSKSRRELSFIGTVYKLTDQDLTFVAEHDPYAAKWKQALRLYYRIALCVFPFALAYTIWRIRVLRGKPRLRVGPTTTFAPGPLKADGAFDFEAALHAVASRGIDPDDNAAVLLFQSGRPDDLPVELRERYVQYLGASESAEQKRRFLDEAAFAQHSLHGREVGEAELQSLVESIAQGLVQPWKCEELPIVARWIVENGDAIALIEAASRRSRCYLPVVNDGPLWQAPAPLQEPVGSAARLLVSRAMRHMAEGELDAALEDLLACHRLASLLRNSLTMSANALGASIEGLANHGAQFLLRYPLSLSQIERYQAGLAGSPQVTGIAGTVEIAVRLEMLDAVQSMEISGEMKRSLQKYRWLPHLEINSALRFVNAHFDALRPILAIPSMHERFQELRQFHAKAERRMVRSVHHLWYLRRLFWSSHSAMSRALGGMILRHALPDLFQLQSIEDRATASRRLLNTALSVAAYRVAHGAFPRNLENLPPTVPVAASDQHCEGLISYEATLGGFVLETMIPGIDGPQVVTLQVADMRI